MPYKPLTHAAAAALVLLAGAQCAHAAIGVVLQLLATDVELYQRWEQCGQRKIVVKVDNTPSMVSSRSVRNGRIISCGAA